MPLAFKMVVESKFFVCFLEEMRWIVLKEGNDAVEFFCDDCARISLAGTLDS
jgi:hypothetical protein